MSAEEIPEFKEISADVHGTLCGINQKGFKGVKKERGKSRQKR